MPRKEEKPTLGARLIEWSMTAGVMVLVGGLVCAFLVAGVYYLHASLGRNEDANMARRGPARAETRVAPAPLEDLKKPLAPPPSSFAKATEDKPAGAQSVAATPAEAAKPAAAPVPAPAKPKETPKPPPPPPPPAKVPEGPPSKDPSRVDNEGFIRYWVILGPIPAQAPMAGAAEVLAARIEGEQNLRPRPDERIKVKGKEFVWKRYKSPEHFIDFRKAIEGPGENVLAYAVAYVYADEDMANLKVLVGSNDQCKVYVNSKAVITHEKSRSLEKDQSIADGVALRKGPNIVVLKVANEGGGWQGCLRFMDRNGTPIRHLRVSSALE